jgi:hypothetical protein
VEWFTSLGTQAKLSSGTLLVYRSALSTHHRETTMGEVTNPLEAKAVTMVLDGIQRAWHLREAAAKAKAPQSINITPAILADIKSHLTSDEPLHSMLWSAATVGVYAMLRPHELLADRHIEGTIDTRALRFSQITFYEKEHSKQTVTLLPKNAESDIDLYAVPDSYTIALGQTKTDQLGKRRPKVVAAAPAVQALWRWCHLRQSLGSSSPLLFACDGVPPLTLRQLLSAITKALVALGYNNPKVTGKCFRRGGASALVAQGISNEDVARVADWHSSSMVNIYASSEAKEARRIATSRLLAPAAPVAAAAQASHHC